MPRVAGIDWATDPKNRALVVLEISESFEICRVTNVADRVEDSVAHDACTNREYAVVAIDIPFGWPRDVETVRADPRFAELRAHVWRQLKAAPKVAAAAG